MQTVEEVAAEIVNGLHFSSNRMVGGRLIGEHYFAAQAIADAVRRERAEIDTLRQELFRIQCGQLDRATDKKRSAKELRRLAWETRDRILDVLK